MTLAVRSLLTMHVLSFVHAAAQTHVNNAMNYVPEGLFFVLILAGLAAL